MGPMWNPSQSTCLEKSYPVSVSQEQTSENDLSQDAEKKSFWVTWFPQQNTRLHSLKQKWELLETIV